MSDSFGGICARVAWLPHSQVRLRSKSLCGSNLVDGPWLSSWSRAGLLYQTAPLWLALTPVLLRERDNRGRGGPLCICGICPCVAFFGRSPLWLQGVLRWDPFSSAISLSRLTKLFSVSVPSRLRCWAVTYTSSSHLGASQTGGIEPRHLRAPYFLMAALSAFVGWAASFGTGCEFVPSK